jgi:predicted acetyltransferase
MSVEVRPIRADELDAYTAQLIRVFQGSRPTPLQLEWSARNVELDRATAAFDQGQMVASAGVYSLPMTLPGGTVAGCAGVTRVSVLPTHRRQGYLRALMRHQLDDIHARGEPIAALYASEAPIYGRFGYGPATWHANVGLKRARSALRSTAPVCRLRFVEPDEAIRVATAVHDALAPQRPGAVHRPGLYWENRFLDTPERRSGGSELNHVVAEGEAGVEGFVSYRLHRRFVRSEHGTVRVGDLLATTAAAYTELWRFATSVDLMDRVEAHDRPADEPFRMALVDARALRVSLEDGIWVRLVDVAQALAARRYSAPGRLVLRVHDPFCPWNEGAFEIEAGADGAAACRPTAAAADLEIDVDDLGACYLGGNRFAALAAAGRVTGGAGAVVHADAMFRSAETPWCPTHF